MSACNFSIPFTGTSHEVINKAKATITSQGGHFEGDVLSGNFDVSVFGNTIKGSYNIANEVIHIVIVSKPFLVPCSTIESFLRSKIG